MGMNNTGGTDWDGTIPDTGDTGSGLGGGTTVTPGTDPIGGKCSQTYAEYASNPDGLESTCMGCGVSGEYDYAITYNWNPQQTRYLPDYPTDAESLCFTSDGVNSSSCTWWSTCDDGRYLDATVGYTKSTCGINRNSPCWSVSKTCKPCYEGIGAPYYNATANKVVYTVTNENSGNKGYKATMTINDFNFPSIVYGFYNNNDGGVVIQRDSTTDYPTNRACLSWPHEINTLFGGTTLNYEYKVDFTTYAEWKDGDKHGCAYCPPETSIITGTNHETCTECNQGSSPDTEQTTCICNTNGYYSPSAGTHINDCAYCGDNASSYKTSTENAFYDGCYCKRGYYNKNGFNGNIYNNRQTNTADCAEPPILQYKYYSYNGTETTLNSGRTIMPSTYNNTNNITLPATDADITKEIQNKSGYIVNSWYATSDTTKTWAPNDTIESENVNEIIRTTQEFIISPKFLDKTIYYYHRDKNNNRQQLKLGNSTNNTQTCTSGPNKCLISFDNYLNSEFKDGYYYKDESETDNNNVTWILTDSNGAKIKDQNENSEYKHNGSDIIILPSTRVDLELKLTECPANYYCTNGIKYACPRGTTTNNETGKSSPEDCVIDDGWKICAGDYCFHITGGLKKFTK